MLFYKPKRMKRKMEARKKQSESNQTQPIHFHSVSLHCAQSTTRCCARQGCTHTGMHVCARALLSCLSETTLFLLRWLLHRWRPMSGALHLEGRDTGCTHLLEGAAQGSEPGNCVGILFSRLAAFAASVGVPQPHAYRKRPRPLRAGTSMCVLLFITKQ